MASSIMSRWCADIMRRSSKRPSRLISIGRSIVMSVPSRQRRSFSAEDSCNFLETEVTHPLAETTRAKARDIRRRALGMVYRAKQGHPGGDMSVTDILATLYFGALKLDPANPNDPKRDRFVLSKGHCTGALYATLAEKGFFPI